MSALPGGPIASRPLHLIWIPDCSGSMSGDMIQALSFAVREALPAMRIPPMTGRALPPVPVLVSDGQPTGDSGSGLKALMDQPRGKKAIRLSIAVGQDADHDVLTKFIGAGELKPLQASNAACLVSYIKWASTAVLKAASSPAGHPATVLAGAAVPIPVAPRADPGAADVW